MERPLDPYVTGYSLLSKGVEGVGEGGSYLMKVADDCIF